MQQSRVCSVCGATYRSGFERCPRDGGVVASQDRDPLIGQVLDDRYRIDRAISEGAMGRVYLAQHTRMSRRFAIKVLFGDLAAQAQMRVRFAREAEAASRLEHKNLVSVVDFGESERGLLYLVMEYIEGRTLERILREEGTFSEERAIRMTRDLGRGLRHLHARGLIHRDLKLENVVVVHDRDLEIPKIVDFGVALLPTAQDPDERLTKAGVIVGTPAFMSPEQAFGDTLDPRSDLFSLGVVLYHLLAGRGPFDGNAFEVIQKVVSAPIPTFAERNPSVHVSPGLEEIVMRLLSKNAAERYPTAQALIEALDDLPGRRALARGISALTPLPDLELDGNVVPIAGRDGSTPGSIGTDVTGARAPRPRRWWPAGLAAGLLTGAAAVLAVFGLGLLDASKEAEPSRPPPPATAPPPVQAEQALVTDPPEEEVRQPAPPKTRKVKTKRARRRRRPRRHRRRRARARRPVEKLMPLSGEVDAKTRVTPEPAQLAEDYRRVGDLIERLASKHGNTVAAAYRLRHVAIPLPASLKTDRERTRVARRLAALRRDVLAELRR